MTGIHNQVINMQNRPIDNNGPRIQAADINGTNNTNQAAQEVRAISNTEECPATSRGSIFATATFAAMLTIGLGLSLYFALSMPIIPITLGVLALAAIVVLTGLVIARSLSDYTSTQAPAPTPAVIPHIPRATCQPGASSHSQSGGRGPSTHTNHGVGDNTTRRPDRAGPRDPYAKTPKKAPQDPAVLVSPPRLPRAKTTNVPAPQQPATPGAAHPDRYPITEKPLSPSPKSGLPYDQKGPRISVPSPSGQDPKKLGPFYIPKPTIDESSFATIRRSPKPPRGQWFTTFQGPADEASSPKRTQPLKVPTPKPPAGGVPLANVSAGTLVRTKSGLKDRGRPDRLSDILNRQQSHGASHPQDQVRSSEPPKPPPRGQIPAPPSNPLASPQATKKATLVRDSYSDLGIPAPPKVPAPPAPTTRPASSAPTPRPKPQLTQDQLEALSAPPPPAGPPPPPPSSQPPLPTAGPARGRMPLNHAGTNRGPQPANAPGNDLMTELKTKFHQQK